MQPNTKNSEATSSGQPYSCCVIRNRFYFCVALIDRFLQLLLNIKICLYKFYWSTINVIQTKVLTLECMKGSVRPFTVFRLA